MAWIKVTAKSWRGPLFVNIDNAFYIRHNQADHTSAVIGFKDSQTHTHSVRNDASDGDSYSSTDTELRVTESVDEILQMIDKPLALLNRMTDT